MHKRRLIQFALAGLAGLTIHPLAAAVASQAADEDLPLLVAGMDAAYPPFGFKDSKTGEFVGFDVDIIRAIGRTAGFRVKVENIPFDGLIPALKTRTIDIAINDIGITAERAKSVDFSDRYYIAGMGIVVAKGYQGIQSAKDLEGKRLAVTIGSTGEIAAKRISMTFRPMTTMPSLPVPARSTPFPFRSQPKISALPSKKAARTCSKRSIRDWPV